MPSLCDPFDDGVPAEWRKDFGKLIRDTPNITWLLLTKRPQNIKRHALDYGWKSTERFPRNVWLGVSVETQDYMIRVERLIEYWTRARILFISFEPLLGQIRFPGKFARRIDFAIVGGESGPGAREMKTDWARDLLKACARTTTKFYMKQLGGHPDKRNKLSGFPEDLRIRQIPR